MRSSLVLAVCWAAVLTLLLLQTSTSIVPVTAAPVTHVILIAGQSNSVGSNAGGPTPEDTTSPNILQLNCCSSSGQPVPLENCTLTMAQDPLLHQCGMARNQHIGFGMSFVRALNATINHGDSILIVPTGIGGTGFIDHTWTEDGPGFIRAINRTNRAFELAVNPVFTAVLWHQGECDAGDNVARIMVTNDTYLYQDIGPLISRFRNSSFIPHTSPILPVIVGQLLPQWLNNVSWPQRAAGVGTALTSVPQIIKHTGYADTKGLNGETTPGYQSGVDQSVIHFDAPSQRILGRIYYQAFSSIKQQQARSRSSPSITTASS